MSQLSKVFFLSLALFLSSSFSVNGGWLPWNPPTLVSIGGEEYSSDDFKSWWENWQEEGMEVPQTPDSYIDWLLLVKEAERMKLYEDPGYLRKSITFLKARTLMLLKFEEVDQKIKLSEDILWEEYLKTHAPRYKLKQFIFEGQQEAKVFYDHIGSTPLSNEDFTDKLNTADGFTTQESVWYRPLAINEVWQHILKDLQTGSITAPLPWGDKQMILRLEELKKGDKSDFATVEKELSQDLHKREANRLTVELLHRLRDKYEVVIDRERLEQLDITAPDESFTDDPIITTSNGTVSERQVMAQIRKQQGINKKFNFSNTDNARMKEHIVNGIIDQTLTSWEGLVRGYEKKPPFDKVYQFYGQHQLTKILANRVFLPNAAIQPEEVQAYYENNLSLYTQPEIVRLATIKGDEKALNNLWLEATLGEDLLAIAQKRYNLTVPVQDFPLNHLPAEIREVVSKLTVNELSKIFTVDGVPTLVMVYKRTPAKVTPIGKVGFEITEMLQKKKLESVRQEYLAKLRAEYPVETNETIWHNLKDELEQKNDENIDK